MDVSELEAGVELFHIDKKWPSRIVISVNHDKQNYEYVTTVQGHRAIKVNSFKHLHNWEPGRYEYDERKN